MHCPFCSHQETSVIDSRLAKEGSAIRRRRQCDRCRKRFTTYEQIEELLPAIVKKDGRRESYDRRKVMAGIQRACEKRPVPTETIDAVVDQIEKDLHELGKKEISSSVIGERVMRELHKLDQVAYVRFASVYREFEDLGEFMNELQGLLKKKKK